MGAFENVTSLTDYFVAGNTLTDGILVHALVVVVFLVLFFSSIVYGRSKALTFASFSTGVLLLVLNIQGLVDYWLIIADLLLFSVGVIVMLGKGEGN